MDRSTRGASREAQRTPLIGIIDSLGIGFDKINGMLWILVFPIALSLFLWRGPQLSAGPAVNAVVDWYFSRVPSDLLSTDVGQSMLLSGEQMREAVAALLGDVNLFSLLAAGIGIAGRGSIPAVPADPGDAIFGILSIARPSQALLYAFALELAGLLLGAGYLGIIGQRVRGERISAWRLLRRVWGYWLSVLGFLLALLVAVISAGLPIVLVLGLAFALAPAAAEAIMTAVIAAWQVAALWLTLFMFFVIDAVVVGELGPLRAIRTSIRLVATHFWSSTAFILLYLVISYGMLALWTGLGPEPWAIFLAIGGNAYIGSGLAAGSMVYFRGRTVPLANTESVRACNAGPS